MVLSIENSNRIVATAYQYLGRPYDYKTFDCVHFIVSVYRDVGIIIPRFGSAGFPPNDFQLSEDEFREMPAGNCAFFKRKESPSNRIWTHAAIILSKDEFIHCSRHFGRKVLVTRKAEFMDIYRLAPQSV